MEDTATRGLTQDAAAWLTVLHGILVRFTSLVPRCLFNYPLLGFTDFLAFLWERRPYKKVNLK